MTAPELIAPTELRPQPTGQARRCRHIFTAGRQCGSPSLRQDAFCFHHHTTRMSAPKAPRRSLAQTSEDFDFPFPEDRDAVQYALGEVMRRIASGHIDLKRAGLLLYGLALASNNLPRASAAKPAIPLVVEAPITDVIMDEHLGPLAPAPANTPEATLEPTQTRTTPAHFRQTNDDALNRSLDQYDQDRITRTAQAAARDTRYSTYTTPPEEFQDQQSRR